VSFRRALKNLFSLSVMRIATALLSFLLFGLLARVWGPELLGEYSTVFTYFMFLMQFPLLGLHLIIVRDVASCSKDTGRYIFSSAFLSFCTSFVIAMLVVAIGWFGYETELHSSFFILALTCFPTAIIVSIESALMGCEKMAVISKVNIVESVIRAALSATLLFAGAPLVALVAVLLFGRIIALLIYIQQVKKIIIFDKKLFDVLLVRRLIKQAPLFFCILLFSASIGRLDLIFLSLWSDGMHDVGIYSVAFKVYEIGIMVPSMITVVLFPIFSRLYTESHKEFRVNFCIVTRIISGIGLPFTIMAGVLSPTLLPMLFGAEYEESIILFQLLCGAIFMTALDQLFTIVLLAAKQEKLELRVLSIAFIVYLGGLAYLIPTLGGVGAALATLLALLIKVIARYYYASRVIDVSLVALKLPSLFISGSLMCFVLYFISDIKLAIFLGLLVYVLSMFFMKAVVKEDLYKLPAMLFNKINN